MIDTASALIARLGAQVSDLTGRIAGALELSTLVTSNNLPQQTPAAFVIPLGLRGKPANAVTGLFRQDYRDMVAVVLVLEAPSDPTGDSARPQLQTIIGEVVDTVCGFAPGGESDGVFELASGDLVKCEGGVVVYQLDFAVDNQLRI